MSRSRRPSPAIRANATERPGENAPSAATRRTGGGPAGRSEGGVEDTNKRLRWRGHTDPSPRPYAPRVRFLWVLPVVLLGFLLGGGARAEDRGPSVRLEVEDVLRGPGPTRNVPTWRWRPGSARSELVRRDGRGRLRGRTPDGDEHVLLDLGELKALVDREPIRTLGIGRRGPPSIVWDEGGDALCAVVRGDLVWVHFQTGTRRRLTETKEPLADIRVSPGGSYVSFARGGELWVVATDDGRPRALTSGADDDILNATLDWVYPEELDMDTAAWWSPNETHIAYLQLDETGVSRFPLPRHLDRLSELTTVRYPKAGDKNPAVRLGIVPVEGGDTTWVDVGTPAPEYVCRVAWHPAGRHVLVVTLDRLQQHLRLLACPIDGGPPRVLLEERDPAWIDLPPAPEFLDPGRFLWRSHRDGSRAWYLALLDPDLAGPVALTPLTARNVDVSRTPVVRDGRVFYVGTPFGSPRRTLLEGRLDGTTELRVASFSPGPLLDTAADLDPTATFAVVTTSSARTPPRADVVRVEDGALLSTLGDERSDDFDRLPLVQPEFGTLDGPHGPIDWCLWTPPNLDVAVPHALLLQVYGGPGSRTVRDAWQGEVMMRSLLAQRGILTLQVDGRGTRGHGTAHERSVYGRLGVAELEDMAYAAERIAERPYVDASRIGITGWSYGGTMAALALVKRSDLFRVGVAIAPVTDWGLYDTIYTERYMGLPASNAVGYRESAVTHQADGMDGRLLLLHGTADDNVHAQNTLQLADALLRAKKSGFEMMLYPGQSHGLGGVRLDLYRRIVAFLEGNL